jgi:hypothetical protein
VLGNDHPNTLIAEYNLAVNLRAVDAHEKTRLSDDTANQCGRVRSEDYPDAAASANDFAVDLSTG